MPEESTVVYICRDTQHAASLAARHLLRVMDGGGAASRFPGRVVPGFTHNGETRHYLPIDSNISIANKVLRGGKFRPVYRVAIGDVPDWLILECESRRA